MFHSAVLDIAEPLVEFDQGSIRPSIKPPKLLIELGQDRYHFAFSPLRHTRNSPTEKQAFPTRAMTEVHSIEMHFCHDSGDCLAFFAKVCLSCRRKDFAGFS